jgi:TPR repeat protein
LRSNPAAPDYNSAIKWLSASTAQGNVDAEFLLGYLYEHAGGN